jgi:hypothetical protein
MKSRLSVLVAIAVVGTLAFSVPVRAETLVESNVDSRLVVALRVAPAEVEKWLQPPWQVNPIASGPSKDANLLIVFLQRLLSQGPDGKPSAWGGTDRAVALVVPGKHAQTGETAPVVIRVYWPYQQGLPGPYKNYVLASVRREQTLKGGDLEPGTGSESWEVRDREGRTLQVQVAYQRAVPSRVKADSKVYSSVEPAFFRIYRVDQGVDVVKSVPAGIDRTQGYQLRSTISELAKLVDGREQLVSITVLAWYVRQVFLP